MLHRFTNFSGIDTSVPDDVALEDYYFPYGYRTGSWAREALTWAKWNGILYHGWFGECLDPTASVSRARTATILHIYLERILNHWFWD